MKKIHFSFVLSMLFLGLTAVVLISCRKYVDYVEESPRVELICELNIPGGCFDQWQMWDDGYGNKCLEPAGNYLRTLNYLNTLPTAAGGPGPTTTTNTPDSYSGSNAALLTTKIFLVQGTPIVIPGLVGTDSLDISNQTIRVGKRYTQKPLKFQGYYKYEPVNGDSALISVLLSKFNTGTAKRDTLGLGRLAIKGAVSSYTFIDLPINYPVTDVTPDSLTLLICSSAGINFKELMHCQGQIGSNLWIDEISFVMP